MMILRESPNKSHSKLVFYDGSHFPCSRIPSCTDTTCNMCYLAAWLIPIEAHGTFLISLTGDIIMPIEAHGTLR